MLSKLFSTVITVLVFVLGCALALVVRRAGRLATIGVTAACGAFMAYFLMPPVFSFQVSRITDLATLAGYGGFSLVLTRQNRRQRPRDFCRDNWSRTDRAPQDRTAIDAAVESLLSSDLGNRLSHARIAIDVDHVIMPWSYENAMRILSAVVTDVIEHSSVRRISISGAQRPGMRRMVVSAHRVWPPPLNVVITTGRSDAECRAIEFLTLPGHSGAGWFDNGYDLIYQFTATEPNERDLI